MRSNHTPTIMFINCLLYHTRDRLILTVVGIEVILSTLGDDTVPIGKSTTGTPSSSLDPPPRPVYRIYGHTSYTRPTDK